MNSILYCDVMRRCLERRGKEQKPRLLGQHSASFSAFKMATFKRSYVPINDFTKMTLATLKAFPILYLIHKFGWFVAKKL